MYRVKVMFSCLMFWMILSFEETDALSNVKVMNLPNGVNITATYLGFKTQKSHDIRKFIQGFVCTKQSSMRVRMQKL